MARFSKYFIEAAVACFSVMIMMSHADALLMSRDDAVFGTDSVTYDSETGLDWLDLSITADLSYNDVSSQLGAGGIYEGWRYARIEDVLKFMIHAGIPDIGTYSFANLEPVYALSELIGIPIPAPLQPVYGLHSPMDDGTIWTSRLYVDFSMNPLPPDDTWAIARPFSHIASMDTAYSRMGSHLIRESAPVPEPATLLLLGSGLIGMVINKKRKTG